MYKFRSEKSARDVIKYLTLHQETYWIKSESEREGVNNSFRRDMVSYLLLRHLVFYSRKRSQNYEFCTVSKQYRRVQV